MALALMQDTKEEEVLFDARERQRIGLENESPTLQLQQLLEQIKQIKIENNIANEEFINTISEFMKSFNDNNNIHIIKDIKVIQDTQENVDIRDFQLLYNDAVQRIYQKENELKQAHLQCHSMATQLAIYKKKYRIDAANCNDDKKQQITDFIQTNPPNADEIFTEEIEAKFVDLSLSNESLNDNGHSMNSVHKYEIDSDCCNSSGDSSCNSELITNNVTFKPMEEYEPISFKISCNLLNDNKNIFCNEYVLDEYDGIQTDWECQSKDNNSFRLQNKKSEYNDNDNDNGNESESEYIQFVNALNELQIKCDGLKNENEMLRNDNELKLQRINDICIKYKNKCIQYEILKCKLSK